MIRSAKAARLPVTCDIAPHHLALSDEWLAGSRRWAWEAVDSVGRARDPWTDGSLVAAPFDSSLRVNPPLRSPEDAAACLAALLDGTADAVATDHAPHTSVDKDVEFGLAANGISGIETALGLLIAGVDAGRLPLLRAIEAMTLGASRVLGDRIGPGSGLVEGEQATLVVFDRADSWEVSPTNLLSLGKNSPLLRLELPGRVLLTIVDGQFAYRDRSLDA